MSLNLFIEREVIIIKLYCVKFRDGDEIIDITHIVASDNKEAHEILDRTLEKCAFHGIEKYNAYSFFEVNKVNDFTILLEKNESVFL